MAFFKFRKNGAEQSGPTPAPESLDVLRKRARHRLIGASALVLLGVVGFPLLFDSQPRPVAVDIAIDIPDKAKAPALTAPTSSAPAPAIAPATPPAASEVMPVARPSSPAVVSASAATSAAAASVSAAKSAPPLAVAASAPVSAAAPQTKASAKQEPKVASKADPKPAAKVEAKAAAKPEDKAQSAGKAQALLDGKDATKPAAAGKRYTVQVGAFADDKKAHEVRSQLEKAGIKTYTQVLNTPDGKRTRVRVGPWENKAEADKTAEKIKKLNLSASVLEL